MNSPRRFLQLNPYLNALAYLIFISTVGIFAFRMSMSRFLEARVTTTSEQSDIGAAIGFDPADPNAYKTAGDIAAKNGDPSGAAGYIEKALSLRTRDYRLYLDLAAARAQSGETEKARMAYKSAVELAPFYVEPNFQFGIFLYNIGDLTGAFRYLNVAAKQDVKLYPTVLKLAAAKYPGDVEKIGKAITPETLEAKRVVALYLVENSLISDELKHFLTGQAMTNAMKDEFTAKLVAKDNFALAHEIWLSESDLHASSKNDPIYDGGFEKPAESDTSVFGWQIDDSLPFVSVGTDNRVFHTGSTSLRVKFSGGVPLNQRIISQMLVLEPRHSYELKFYYRSREIISAGYPIIAVMSGNSANLLAASSELKSTGEKWTGSTFSFTTRDEPAVQITLQRITCEASPCPIFGELYLDSFSLSAR